jgi:hypothetical protein
MAALVSSQENASVAAPLAIDGDASTRWSSAFADFEWIAVDLGAAVSIDRVRIRFEYASSRRYTLQVSDTGRFWNTVYTENAGPLGPVTADVSGLNSRARYVRLYSTERNTPYGISVYEFDVFGDADPGCSAQKSIVSLYSGKALDVSTVSSQNGANIHQWTNDGGANQKWELLPIGANQYQLRALHSAKCADIAGPSNQDGANIHQWDCHSGTSQRWNLEQVAPGQHRLVNVYSGKCLDVAEFSQNNGGNIHQWACSGSPNQTWILSDVSL